MFIRTKIYANKDGTRREYLTLVENERVGRKVRQKTLAKFGRTDILKESGIANLLVEKFSLWADQKRLIDLAKEGRASWAKDYGALVLWRGMWEKLGFSKLLKDCLSRCKKRTDLGEAVFLLAASRLEDPGSELHSHHWKSRVYEPAWEGVEIQHLYRALDFLMEHKGSLEQAMYDRAVTLFNQELDLVMFDTTTIKYWGEGKNSQVLQHGHSKERRMDLKQLIVGILMTKEGIPIAHEVWPGNTSDLKSFKETIEKLKKKYRIGKLVWVADRGMVSADNLRLLQEWGQEYILGVKMRQFNKEKRSLLLNPRGMRQVHANLFVKEVEIKGQGRYIVCFNPQEAAQEKKKRAYFKQILEDRIRESSMKEWIMKNGYRKYIDLTNGEIRLNEERLNKENIFDGYWVLVTNTKLRSREAALYYKGLWQIEAGFKSLKDELEAGPIYHWTDQRIRGHIFVCFLALLLKLTFKNQLKAHHPQARTSEVLGAVRQIKAVKINAGDQEIIFRTEFPAQADIAFRATGVAPPPRVLSYQKLKSVVATSG